MLRVAVIMMTGTLIGVLFRVLFMDCPNVWLSWGWEC